MEGEGTRASAQPHPRYLRPLAGSLDGSEPQPASGTKTGSQVGGQVLQGPRWRRLPALESQSVSWRQHDLYKPRLTQGRLGVDWLLWGRVAGGVSGGDRVASEAPLQDRAPPSRADLPGVVRKEEGCTPLSNPPRGSDPGPQSRVRSVDD